MFSHLIIMMCTEINRGEDDDETKEKKSKTRKETQRIYTVNIFYFSFR